MVELQILCRVLKDKSLSILSLNGITEDYFVTYTDEYSFIAEHFRDFGNVPDKETFLAKFPSFTPVDVNESNKYLVDTFNEEHLYAVTVPVLNMIAELMQTDARSAVEYLQSQLPTLAQNNFVIGTDIIADAAIRLQTWKERCANPTHFCIPTGFAELDEILGGWQRGEEFAVIFARTGQGKTWILLKSLEHAHKMGYRVGIVEPEMSATKTGYRFDTLHCNVSNTSLNRGEELNEYEDYIESLTHGTVPFIVASPKEFKRKVTVSKLRSFVESAKLDMLAIDGISYLDDERKQRGDSRTTALTNVSEDLMELSIELGIPIIVVCQSNREGAKDDDAPDLENIRDSDGIAYNASTVIAVKQKGPGVELFNRKNRYGRTGDKLTYLWDIDTGVFKYIPNDDASHDDSQQIAAAKQSYDKGTEVF